MSENEKAQANLNVSASGPISIRGSVTIDGMEYSLTSNLDMVLRVNDSILHSIEVMGVSTADIRLVNGLAWDSGNSQAGGIFKFTNPGSGGSGQIFIVYS